MANVNGYVSHLFTWLKTREVQIVAL